MTEKQPRRPLKELLADNDLINAALARASREALLSHARAGRAVPICPNGEIVWLSPEEILAQYADSESPRPS